MILRGWEANPKIGLKINEEENWVSFLSLFILFCVFDSCICQKIQAAYTMKMPENFISIQFIYDTTLSSTASQMK